MIRSSTGSVHEWYQTPSGQTTAIGPPAQICRQSALVRWTPPPSFFEDATRPSSRRRRLRKVHDCSPVSREQQLCFSDMAQRNTCRSIASPPICASARRASSMSSELMRSERDSALLAGDARDLGLDEALDDLGQVAVEPLGEHRPEQVARQA